MCTVMMKENESVICKLRELVGLHSEVQLHYINDILSLQVAKVP